MLEKGYVSTYANRIFDAEWEWEMHNIRARMLNEFAVYINQPNSSDESYNTRAFRAMVGDEDY